MVKKGNKLSLAEFLSGQGVTSIPSQTSSSWADENSTFVELPSAPSARFKEETYSSSEISGQIQPIDFSKLPSNPPFNAYIGNLPWDITKESLYEFFGKEITPKILRVNFPRDFNTKKLKGFGYIEFSCLEAMKKALEFNGKEFQGRILRMDISESKTTGSATEDWTRKPREALLETTKSTASTNSSNWRSASAACEATSSSGPTRVFSSSRNAPLPKPQAAVQDEIPTTKSNPFGRAKPKDIAVSTETTEVKPTETVPEHKPINFSVAPLEEDKKSSFNPFGKAKPKDISLQ